jgi:carboxypeptidase Taq
MQSGFSQVFNAARARGIIVAYSQDMRLMILAGGTPKRGAMTKLELLKKRLAEVCDLRAASALLGWDQQTFMPTGGGAARAEQLATLDRLAHELFIAPVTGELLSGAKMETDRMGYDSNDSSLVRVAEREYKKASRVPAELVSEMARTTSQAMEIWAQAKIRSAYAQFRPILQRVFELNRDLAQCLGYQNQLYDALLDQYEPGLTTRTISSLFVNLKSSLVELAQSIAAKDLEIDEPFLCAEYEPGRQWDFGLEVARKIGFNFQCGRQDKSAHPFTTSFSIHDVRITTRVNDHYLPSALFGTLHESGHALYEQGVDQKLERTLLSGGASLGLHESQSRLWENQVGRSRPFWNHFYPRLMGLFPSQLSGVSAEIFYRAINRVKPSLIRVEADEVTYNLHILLRFELEMDLLEDRIGFDELPAAWNQKMKDYLGITSPDDGRGVLQDVHWASGLIGYFPTYTLGNLLSAQLFRKVQNEIPQLREEIGRGEFQHLLDWLRRHIHRHGRKYEPVELIQKAIGEPLEAEPFLEYLRNKFGEIYRL